MGRVASAVLLGKKRFDAFFWRNNIYRHSQISILGEPSHLVMALACFLLWWRLNNLQNGVVFMPRSLSRQRTSWMFPVILLGDILHCC